MAKLTKNSALKQARKQEKVAKKKREPLKYIAILPSTITLMNGFFGFLSIIIASHEPGMRWQFPLLPQLNLSYISIAAWMIFLGMIADMLDGRIARMSGYTSSFGGQLDSLCDAISFGVAPAFLSCKLLALKIEALRNSGIGFSIFVSRWILFCAILFAMCAIVRLARFNVENDEDEAAHMNFVGLPTPAAAGLIISLALFHEDFLAKFGMRFPGAAAVMEKIISWSIPFALFICGILMVTRITYPHAVNHLIRDKKPFPILILVIVVGLLAIWNIQLVLLAGFLGFILGGVAYTIGRTVKKKTALA